MSLVGKLIGYVLAIGLLVGSVFALVEVFRFIVHVTMSIRSDELPVIIPAVVATIGFLGVMLQKYMEKRKDVEFKLREEKVKVYDSLMTQHFNIMYRGSQGEQVQLSDEELRKGYDINKDMILWGSDRVLKKYVEYRDISQNELILSNSPQDFWKCFSELMLTFRKDLGHKNRGIKYDDLLRFFINDYDGFIQNGGQNASDSVAGGSHEQQST